MKFRIEKNKQTNDTMTFSERKQQLLTEYKKKLQEHRDLEAAVKESLFFFSPYFCTMR